MFSNENSYAFAVIAVLTVAMVTAMAMLARALDGFQTFW
jgi:hypothetical protein